MDMEGFEPTTSRLSAECSNQNELHVLNVTSEFPSLKPKEPGSGMLNTRIQTGDEGLWNRRESNPDLRLRFIRVHCYQM